MAALSFSGNPSDSKRQTRGRYRHLHGQHGQLDPMPGLPRQGGLGMPEVIESVRQLTKSLTT